LELVIRYYFSKVSFQGSWTSARNGSLLRVVTVGVFNRVGVANLHVETERLISLNEHVEGFRDAASSELSPLTMLS